MNIIERESLLLDKNERLWNALKSIATATDVAGLGYWMHGMARNALALEEHLEEERLSESEDPET